jgi:glycosyltransferase involved in cell wall biosynthesis|tara:strand:- start:18 stop:791 length:774 start_codon:yes stop_codon:yes gene_type:complete
MKKNNNFINLKKKEPLFSIITVVLNNDKYLEKTIKSVIGQKNKDFEYIIIDGGSKDNSLQIIKKYKNKINYFISERDRGIYDAFNKGMSLARGRFICIVNSDDILKKNALNIIKKYIDQNSKIDFIFGSVKKHWGVLHGYRPEKIKYSWGFYSSHSTGFYVKRESAKKIGLYNLKYKYHADYDYFYRMIVKKKMKGIATKKSEIVGIFRRGGFSSKISYRRSFLEELKIRYDNNQNILNIIIIAIYKFFKHFKKIIK